MSTKILVDTILVARTGQIKMGWLDAHVAGLPASYTQPVAAGGFWQVRNASDDVERRVDDVEPDVSEGMDQPRLDFETGGRAPWQP